MKWVNNETPTYMFIHINSDNSIAVIDYEQVFTLSLLFPMKTFQQPENMFKVMIAKTQGSPPNLASKIKRI